MYAANTTRMSRLAKWILCLGLTLAAPMNTRSVRAEGEGWKVDQAPQQRVLPLQLDQIAEKRLLRVGGKATLFAVGGRATDFHPEREALVLVHGLGGKPAELQSFVDRLHGDDTYQIYVLLYDDLFRRTSLNGTDFAEELEDLVLGASGSARRVTILAHSMGGIVARLAMNQLTQRRTSQRFDSVRLIAMDTPWHGFGGPSDHGAGGLAMALSRPFLPDGLEDMRAESDMFGTDQTNGARLSHVMLPEHFDVTVLFGTETGVVLRSGEGALRPFVAKLVDLYSRDIPVRGSAQLMNYWHALVASSQYYPFQEEMRMRAEQGTLSLASAERLLEKYFPRFGGDHMSMLLPTGPGARAVDFLAHALSKSSRSNDMTSRLFAKR